MRARYAAALLALCAAGAFAQGESLRPEETHAEQVAAGRVRAALEARDCPKAVQLLKDGLSARYPGLYLFAGTMYEEGLCLKPDWERAQRYYLAGLEAGHRGGLYKLIAGLAHGPRDMAAALWWAQRGLMSGAMPAPCLVEPKIHEVPESYVAALRSWPAGQVAACVHIAGVVAMIVGDVQFPSDSLGLQLTGRVAMNFVPAHGRIEWTTLESDAPQSEGVVSGAWLRDRESRGARDSFRRHLDDIGRRALKRFEPRPPGIDPEWQARMQYVFTLR